MRKVMEVKELCLKDNLAASNLRSSERPTRGFKDSNDLQLVSVKWVCSGVVERGGYTAPQVT